MTVVMFSDGGVFQASPTGLATLHSYGPGGGDVALSLCRFVAFYIKVPYHQVCMYLRYIRRCKEYE